MLILSCHSDTTQTSHSCSVQGELIHGHLDNFAGVYAVMQAYFSGRLNMDWLRIELTYGEETDYAGAYGVLNTLNPHDVVIVVDVTSTPTEGHLVVEKCRRPSLRRWLGEALEHVEGELYPHCPDPVSDQDETDVYSEGVDRVLFLGVPTWGGDYNEGPVWCRRASIEAVAEAICCLAESFPDYCEGEGIPVH